MKVENIDIDVILTKANKMLKEEKNLSPAFAATIEVVLLAMKLLCNRLSLNSSNSSKPPSQDLNRLKKSKKTKGKKKDKRKPGAQLGHKGSTLIKVDNPNEVEELLIDRKTLPAGKYKRVGFETRQVFGIKLSLNVKEYRAEILENKNGDQYVASFPTEVTKATQYANEVKAESVYMSMFQLIPLARVEDFFNDQVGLEISKGSISNFNKEASAKLREIGFREWATNELLQSLVNHADETGINLNGKRIWLHNLSNEFVTLYHPDLKRGKEAMDRMGILPFYRGTLCHDHWKPYYHYFYCLHSLCNAHHLRELVFAYEEDGQKWAKKMEKLLLKINKRVKECDGVLSGKEIKKFEKQYRAILSKGKSECPVVEKKQVKQGRTKKTKSRNLLERLIDFEEDTLRFMKVKEVPFTNNQGENDLRMTKVQQKISGCFRTMEGAEDFCLIRGYLVTARKHGMSPTDALRILFAGGIPDFMKKK